MDTCAGPGFALPWSGKEEEVPLGGECDDCDVPFVIRDANGLEVLTIWENYGPGFEENHVQIGERIIKAVNRLTSPKQPNE